MCPCSTQEVHDEEVPLLLHTDVVTSYINKMAARQKTAEIRCTALAHTAQPVSNVLLLEFPISVSLVPDQFVLPCHRLMVSVTPAETDLGYIAMISKHQAQYFI